jgi:hypothetical protein
MVVPEGILAAAVREDPVATGEVDRPIAEGAQLVFQVQLDLEAIPDSLAIRDNPARYRLISGF